MSIEVADPMTLAGFAARWLRALLMVGVVLAVALVLVLSLRVLLYAFAGVLLALFWRGLAEGVHRWTRLGMGMSLTLVMAAFLGLLGLVVVLVAPQIAEQVPILVREMPRAVEGLVQRLMDSPLGPFVARTLEGSAGPGAGQIQTLVTRVGEFLTATAGGLVEFVVMLYVGAELAIRPGLYIDGALRLLPEGRRARAREVLDALGQQLKLWLVTRFVVMLIIGVLTMAGLWLLDMPMVLTLALVAALMEFIPFVGPILAAIPAIILAVSDSLGLALYVALLYWLLQTLENYVLSPILHQKIVDIAPALVIVAEVGLAILLGFLGLVLASPLLVVIAVLTRMVYREDILRESETMVPPPGTAAPAHARGASYPAPSG